MNQWKHDAVHAVLSSKPEGRECAILTTNDLEMGTKLEQNLRCGVRVEALNMKWSMAQASSFLSHDMGWASPRRSHTAQQLQPNSGMQWCGGHD